MDWKKNFYYGPKALEESSRIKKSLKRKKWLPGIYLIALTDNPEHLLEVYECSQFLQPGLHTKELPVIGIAKGQEEAYELVRTLIDEVYQVTGALDVKTYFESK